MRKKEMLDSEVVEVSEDFAKFNDFAGGIDTIDGRTFDLISEALQLESSAFTDGECIQIIENIIKQYHQWHKVNAGEGVFTCKECDLTYALSAERIEAEAPNRESFICDICADKGEEANK